VQAIRGGEKLAANQVERKCDWCLALPVVTKYQFNPGKCTVGLWTFCPANDTQRRERLLNTERGKFVLEIRTRSGMIPIWNWRMCNQRKMCGHPQSDPYCRGALYGTLTPRRKKWLFLSKTLVCQIKQAESFFPLGPRTSRHFAFCGRAAIIYESNDCAIIFQMPRLVYCNIWHAVQQQWSLTFLAHSAIIFYAFSRARPCCYIWLLFVLHALFAWPDLRPFNR